MYVFCFLNKVLSKYLTHDSSNPILKETFAMLKKMEAQKYGAMECMPQYVGF